MEGSKFLEWLLNVNHGKSYIEPGRVSFDISSYEPPMYRTRQAMIQYAKLRNEYRWKRLNKDFLWLKKMMSDMGANPEDARFLL